MSVYKITLAQSASSLLDNNTTARAPTKKRDSFLQRKHHSPAAYSRIENWLPDVQDFSFKTEFLSLSAAAAEAILTYRDETKLRATHRDHERAGKTPPGCASIDDPVFLDEMYAFIQKDWGKEKDLIFHTKLASLQKLQAALEAAVKRIDQGHGVFIKLSVRSPKDAALTMSRTHANVRKCVRASTLELAKGQPTPETVKEDFTILNKVSAEALRVRDGAYALRLLLESDRVNMDLMAHRLYLKEDESFNLRIAVREWCPEVNPEWEFRLFVVKEIPTALTVYDMTVFDSQIVIHEKAIEALIMNTWRSVSGRVHKHSHSYCIDFAVTPDAKTAFIIEVNDFLPPVAGSGLFEYTTPKDRALLEKGPFSFRVRKKPLVSHGVVVEGVGVRTMPQSIQRILQTERASRNYARGTDTGRGCVLL